MRLYSALKQNVWEKKIQSLRRELRLPFTVIYDCQINYGKYSRQLSHYQQSHCYRHAHIGHVAQWCLSLCNVNCSVFPLPRKPRCCIQSPTNGCVQLYIWFFLHTLYACLHEYSHVQPAIQVYGRANQAGEIRWNLHWASSDTRLQETQAWKPQKWAYSVNSAVKSAQ